MAHLRKATIENEVSAKIDSWLRDAHEYLDPFSFEFKSLWRDAEKLANADAFAASLMVNFNVRAPLVRLLPHTPEA